MTNEWKRVRLGEICEIKGGKRLPKNKFLLKYKTLHPYIKIKDLTNTKNLKISKDFEYINDETYEYIKNYIVNTNDIILSIVGTIGLVNVIDKTLNNANLTENCVKLKYNINLINKDFLYYYLISNNCQNEIKKSIVGAVQEKLPIYNIKNLEISLPPIQTQEKIAKILSLLDEKIEINNKINENLEEQAMALFNNWLYNNKDKTFNVKIKDVFLTANTGADAIKKAPIANYNTGIRCVRVGDMTNNRDFINWGFTNVDEKTFKQYQLKKDDIIITRTANIGLNKIILKDIQAVYNNGIIKITLNKNKINPLFLFMIMQNKDFINYIKKIEAETSVRPNMKINYLLNYDFISANLDNQNFIINIIKPLFYLKELNTQQSQTLAQIRDLLLPKLMSGQINLDNINLDNINLDNI